MAFSLCPISQTEKASPWQRGLGRRVLPVWIFMGLRTAQLTSLQLAPSLASVCSDGFSAAIEVLFSVVPLPDPSLNYELHPSTAGDEHPSPPAAPRCPRARLSSVLFLPPGISSLPFPRETKEHSRPISGLPPGPSISSPMSLCPCLICHVCEPL